MLAHGATLARIGNAFQLVATGVSLSQLADLLEVDEVATVAVADSAANVSAGFSELLALGASLASVTLSDKTPVLALTRAEHSAGTAVLATLGGNWQVDLSEVDAASVSTLAAEETVRRLSVSDTAAAIGAQWSPLVSAWSDGSGKLAALALSDDETLALTEEQQTEGAAMIAALLADETLVTAP